MADLGNFDIQFLSEFRLVSNETPTYPVYKQRLAGITYFDGIAGPSKVLILGADGSHIGTVFTDVNGVWEINGISTYWTDKPLIVISLDETYSYNAEVFSNVFAVV